MHDKALTSSTAGGIDASDYAELLANLDLAVAVNDTCGRIYAINDAFADLFGYSVQEAPHVNIRQMVPADYGDDLEHHWAALDSGEARSMSGGRKLIHKDGSTRWVRVHASAARRQDRTLVLTVVEDWTDHKWSDPGFMASTDPADSGN
ncbi:PAS domain S-box protein [Rhodococcus sp. D2-41]|uniref:PAS domain S-box protein n=1 Tax=Speluncibacter jeojiensis TaxID=2710754 RepID=UPI00241036C5|nr:PAS domain S-box protein [Rhodococcus sp. D2-41]MDG3010273.1 PAS domain S-box protein [Rhodococcus sp. D2-41]